MNRLEKLRDVTDGIVLENPEPAERRSGMIHLYTVAQNGVLLAKKRGLDLELSAMMGMLHDIYSYRFHYTPDHAEKGAVFARKILTELALTSPEEMELICHAIRCHSNKAIQDGPYDELLKDADVMSHCLYNPGFSVKAHERERYRKLCWELGMETQRGLPNSSGP